MTNISDNSTASKVQLHRWALQEKKVFACFFQQPRTMRQVANLTGVDRANICRFVGTWKKTGSIKVVHIGPDPLTKIGGVQFLSTNEMLWSKREEVKVDKFGQAEMFQ